MFGFPVLPGEIQEKVPAAKRQECGMMKHVSRFLFSLLFAAILCGCRRGGLPDPQVVPGPVRSSAASPTAAPLITASPTPSLTPSKTFEYPTPSATPTAVPLLIDYDVPVISQEGLLLNGAPTGVGCVPACIGMMTAWWNRTDSRYPVLSAQEVIDRNAEQGLYIAGRGMTSLSAADELAELGYIHEMRLNSSKEELLDALEKHGPVSVLVKTNWVPNTMNHAAVLTRYDETADEVTLNDPFYGSTVTWSWGSFDGIWGLNYAGDRDYSGDVIRRVFFTIYPDDRKGPQAARPENSAQ